MVCGRRSSTQSYLKSFSSREQSVENNAFETGGQITLFQIFYLNAVPSPAAGLIPRELLPEMMPLSTQLSQILSSF